MAKLKKLTAMLTAALLTLGFMATTVYAGDESRVCIGNDLTKEQREQVYKDFGVEPGSVQEITVTIDDERATLGQTSAINKIGKKSISCVYIEVRDDGGIFVDTNNINWCTSEMYINALTTAGIKDAKIKVTAPFAVSGTAALTGIYKAYEAVTGSELNSLAKSLAASELVTTGELADVIGSKEASDLIATLKESLKTIRGMDKSEVIGYIRETAKQLGVTLDDSQVEQIYNLLMQFANMSDSEWDSRLGNLKNSLNNLKGSMSGITGFFEAIGSFFAGIGQWFANLFK